eukprot:1154923-Pelagomonas_calceolata.AAC.2
MTMPVPSYTRVIVLEDNDVLHLTGGGYGIYNTAQQGRGAGGTILGVNDEHGLMWLAECVQDPHHSCPYLGGALGAKLDVEAVFVCPGDAPGANRKVGTLLQRDRPFNCMQPAHGPLSLSCEPRKLFSPSLQCAHHSQLPSFLLWT